MPHGNIKTMAANKKHGFNASIVGVSTSFQTNGVASCKNAH